MSLSRVTAGQLFNPTSRMFNAFIEAANRSERSTPSNPVPTGKLAEPRANELLVKNNLGLSLPRFGVIGLDTALITPTANQTDFETYRPFNGALPDKIHRGRFGIAQEPIADGEIGRVQVSGITPVRIHIPAYLGNGLHAELDPTATKQHLRLRMTGHGSTAIVWREGGVAPVEEWAIVELGIKPQVFPVRMVQLTGVNGNSTTQCSFKYRLDDYITGEVIDETDLVLNQIDPTADPNMFQRPSVGFMEPATFGLAYYTHEGKPAITWCNEILQTEAC